MNFQESTTILNACTKKVWETYWRNHTHTHIYIYIYIYIEREREREQDKPKQWDKSEYFFVFIFKVIIRRKYLFKKFLRVYMW